MDIDLKSIIKNLSFILKDASSKENILIKFIDEINKMLNTDTLLLDIEGSVIYETSNYLPTLTIKNDLTNEIKIETQALKQIQNIEQIKINITLDNLYITKLDRKLLKDIYGAFLPIYIFKEKIAIIIFYKNNECFQNDIDVLYEYISSILSILIWNYKNIEITEKQTKKENIKSCIATLSYSELEAILAIFNEIQNNEGLIVASKIADRVDITRSVIVNALRKLESARIIETRSLGMKGTYIKIINQYLLKELKKFKN